VTPPAAPRVVALVPVWRAAGFIAATLDSLVAQTHPNLEILISDDASPDDTAAICEGYAARDPRVRMIRQPLNLGWIGNVNALLREARGDYLLFAFHDDLLEPSYVERCVAALEANHDAILAFSDIGVVYPDGRRESRSYAVLDGTKDRAGQARRVARQEGAWWIPNRGVFRARAAPAIGGLRRHLAGEYSADWPWLLQLSLLGTFVRVPERLCTKIYQPRSLSRGWDLGLKSATAVVLSAMQGVWGSSIPISEKAVLLGTLGALGARRARRAFRGAAGRRLRSHGWPAPAPVPDPVDRDEGETSASDSRS